MRQTDVDTFQTTKAMVLDVLSMQQFSHTLDVAEFLRRDPTQHVHRALDGATVTRALSRGSLLSLDEGEVSVHVFGLLTHSQGTDARNSRSKKAEDTHVS